MCSSDDILNKVIDFEKKNEESHRDILANFNNSLSALEDNLTSRHIELATRVDNASKNLDLAAERVKLAAQAAEASSQGAITAATISKTYKWIITSLIGLLIIVAGFTFDNYNVSIKSSNDVLLERIKTNQILDSINTTIKKSVELQSSLDTKALMDTITVHWKKENKFYNKEFIPQYSWTHDVFDKQIYPNTLFRMKSELKQKDMEIRLSKLESKIE